MASESSQTKEENLKFLSAGTTAGSSSSKEPSDASKELFTSGKRCYIIGEFQKAVDMLQQACSELSDCYGEDSDHLAEPYFYYGKSLLELVRSESDVLGNGVPGGAEAGSDDSEMEEDENETAEEESASGKAEQMADISGKEGGGGDDDTAASSGDAGASNVDEAPASVEGTGSAEESSAEDVSNIQLAWEVLELARLITARTETREKRLRLADIHLSLAETALENSQFEQAVSDFESALKIRKELLEDDSRLIAEVHFQCGLPLAFLNKHDEAIAHTESAARVLHARIKRTQNNADKDEIDTLKSILEEVEAKIIDLKDEQKSIAIVQAAQASQAGCSSFPAAGSSGFPGTALSGFSGTASSGFPGTASSGFPGAESSGFSSAGSSASATTDAVQMISVRKKVVPVNGSSEPETVPVNNITSMVRKKRPTETVVEEASKAQKLNGNGHA